MARNHALKYLYTDPKINAKILDWAKGYNLRNKTVDDVLQEGVIKLDELIRNDKFRGESKVETFLLGICHNIIRDSVKKVSRIHFKDSFTEAEMDKVSDYTDHIVVEEETAIERERDAGLRKILQSLSEKCQESLRLYYFESKSMSDIAVARGLANAGQAKKNVYRCRESLKKLIVKQPELMQLLKPQS